ncbi:MAG TPA: signal peptidase I [Holophaga sp.]|nr:signal peptidase I [Holophaga sp.]
MKPWLPAAALAVAFLPLAFVHPVRVSGHSMEPTLVSGSIRLALRGWCAGSPERGEVWVIASPDGLVTKRVVGLPGERLEQKDGELYLGDRRLPEPYLQQYDQGGAGPWETGGGFLVAGDNRRQSRDGRAWGPLPREAFLGRLLGP